MKVERIKQVAKSEVRAFTIAALVLLALSTVLGLAGIDRVPNFHSWLAIGSGIVLVLAIGFGRRFRTVAAVVLVANLAVLMPFAPVKTAMGQSCTGDLEAVSINAWADLSDHDALVERIQRERPSVLYVSELTDELDARLAALYPQRALNPHNGAALYTVFDIIDVAPLVAPSGLHPLDALLATPNGELRVIGAHPPAPANANWRNARNADLVAIARAVNAVDKPTIVLGDLNITMFSPHYDPLTDAGLSNAREGRGVAATWPEFSPLRIPIDHVMHTGDLTTCDLRVGESFGSDHLPLHASLKWNTPLVSGPIASR